MNRQHSTKNTQITDMDYKGLIYRFIKFACTSLIGASVDFGLLWVLNRYLFDGYTLEYIVAPIISFEASVIVSFTACWFLIWNDRISNKTFTSFGKHLAAYNLSTIGVFVIKMVLLLILQRIFGWSAFICNIIARMISGLLNFVLGEKVIFKEK